MAEFLALTIISADSDPSLYLHHTHNIRYLPILFSLLQTTGPIKANLAAGDTSPQLPEAEARWLLTVFFHREGVAVALLFPDVTIVLLPQLPMLRWVKYVST